MKLHSETRITYLSAVIFDNDDIVLNSAPINFEATHKVFEGYASNCCRRTSNGVLELVQNI